MNELYWITRLEYIQILFVVLLIISVVAIVASWISLVTEDFEEDDPAWKIFKKAVPVALIASLGLIFVPSTKDMFLIYGIGGTVDFLKENPTAKQLPDKCIEALDKFMDEYMNEDNEK